MTFATNAANNSSHADTNSVNNLTTSAEAAADFLTLIEGLSIKQTPNDIIFRDVFKYAFGANNRYDRADFGVVPVAPPRVIDSGQPAGSLRVEDNIISTAGGYTVEILGATEWKITGPDGKSTRVWGDPHVEESDREGGNAEGNGGWDFKRNSTFVLGDGTRINVTTVPGGALGATVTGGLEIISGNDRVLVSDMEKGTGVISAVTQDGYDRVNSFQGDVFVMMNGDASDWAFSGSEVMGSEGLGERFQLANGTTTSTSSETGFANGLTSMFQNWDGNYEQLREALQGVFPFVFNFLVNPVADNQYAEPAYDEDIEQFDRTLYQDNLNERFADVDGMVQLLRGQADMQNDFASRRFNNNNTLRP